MNLTNDKLSRRDALKTGGLIAAGTALAGAWPTARAWAAEPAKPKQRVLRFAHMTDVHVQPELGAGEGLISCLHHVQSQPDKPELIVSGGDAVMDGASSTRDRTQLQWKLWHDVLRKECSLPVEACIGNHDVWGWNKKKSQATGEEADYGKKWAVQALGLSERFRSFDRNGWHFIVLDSIFPGHDDLLYVAKVDEAQFDWLKKDLDAVDPKKPVLVVSHIPILSASVMAMSEVDKEQTSRRVGVSLMHMDFRELNELFNKHPNVKVCLSGHTHLVDRVEYDRVTYLNNGAVCGNWWRGDHLQCKPGYALVNLYDDGSFDSEYVSYGWLART